jgi:hypothetical protein
LNSDNAYYHSVQNLVYSRLLSKNLTIRIYKTVTDSLRRRQLQQSFNTLTPFNLVFYSLHVSAPTGHPQVRYTISYYLCFFKGYFNTTDPLHICNLIIISKDVICRSSSVFQLIVLIHVIILNKEIVKLVKFHITSGVVAKLFL